MNNTLRRIYAAAAAVVLAVLATAQVKPGIEVLAGREFSPLKGKRVGLLTNPTGVDSRLKSTIDILHEAPDVELVALFAPEHGVRGDVAAGERVATSTDPATGIKVYSLYGATKTPTPEMLAGIDVLVYDIQDNGCRSYTFISSMGMAMEACARDGKEFMVLDRPDPLTGNKVEGAPTAPGNSSFVAKYPIPYIYGLTAGELARMIVGEEWLKSRNPLKLTVVPMEGWERDMLWEDTGLPWVPTSPQLPSAETALYYPATGIAGELDYISIGVGYTLPFRTFAATWINGRKFADELNSRNIPGVLFRPISYKPYFGFEARKQLQGVEVYITDFEAAPLTLIQFHAMDALAKLYPAHKASAAAKPARFNMFDKVTGSKEIRPLFFRSHSVADLIPAWEKGVEDFKVKKEKYHLYR